MNICEHMYKSIYVYVYIYISIYLYIYIYVERGRKREREREVEHVERHTSSAMRKPTPAVTSGKSAVSPNTNRDPNSCNMKRLVYHTNIPLSKTMALDYYSLKH